MNKNISKVVYTHLFKKIIMLIKKPYLGVKSVSDLTEKCFLLHMVLLESTFSVTVRFAKTFFAPDPRFRSDFGGKFIFIC